MSHVKVMMSRLLGELLLLIALIISFGSCNKSSEKPAPTEAVQKTFASPDDAGKALADAAKAGSHDALIAIFGPGSQDVIFSGDTAAGQNQFRQFHSRLCNHESLAQTDRRQRSTLPRSRQ